MMITQYLVGAKNLFVGTELTESDGEIDISEYPVIQNNRTFIEPQLYDVSTEIPVWEKDQWVLHNLSEFAEPGPTLDDLRALKITEIGEAFNEHISGRTPITLGWDMQFNRTDISAVDGAVRYLGMTGGTNGYLTDADDITHRNLTFEQMSQALLEMTGAYLQAHNKKQLLRDMVNAAEDALTLNDISWESI